MRTKPKLWRRALRGRVLALPAGAVRLASDAGLRLIAALSGRMRRIGTVHIDPRQVRRLQEHLTAAAALGHPRDHADSYERLVEEIRRRSTRENRNNVTRTAAYLAYFRRHPEVHWAFLAHMVSRNGGWNMTDLQGELLSPLLETSLREQLFSALETANAAIFGDAYPQLILYEESIQRGKPLFFLLPRFGVSVFMQSVWERFWEERSSALLTMGLIVNEQHVIERQVIARAEVQEEALGSLPFQAQSALQLNQVIFPFSSGMGASPRLAGGTIENFNHVKERIEFGKMLYAALWAIPEVAQGAIRFAESIPHTASRSDYWPDRFTADRSAASAISSPRLFYSPRLEDAWPDRPLPDFKPQDWFQSAKEACAYLGDAKAPYPYDMSGEHLYWLQMIRAASAFIASVK